MTTGSKVVLLLALYLSQGLPFGLFTQALPVWMREAGHSLGHIGLTNLLALPWALKFLWAPIVDRSSLSRRGFIVPLQLAAIVLLSGIAFLDPNSLAPLLLAVLLTNLFAATQDIATDALAVDLLTPSQRGWGNGIQVAGYRLGMIIGGGALLVALERIGWTESFLIAAAILGVATLPVLLLREDARPLPDRPPRFSAGLLHVWFARAGAGRWFWLLVAYKFGDALGTGMVRPFLVDRGYTMEDIGWLLGTIGSVMGLTGAILGGLLVRHAGRRTAMVAFASLQTFTLVLYLLASLRPYQADDSWIVAAVVTEHLFSGMATAALFTAMMDVCRPGTAGTDFTVQASVVVIAQGVAAISSGFVADALGYDLYFAVSAVLCGLAAFMVATHRAVAPFALDGQELVKK